MRDSGVSCTTTGLPDPVSLSVISLVSGFAETTDPAVTRKVPKTTSSAATLLPSALFCPRARS